MLNYIIFIIGCILCLVSRKLATNFCRSYHPDDIGFCYVIGTIFASLLTFFYWAIMIFY